MPDIPASSLATGIEAVYGVYAKRGWNKPAPWWAEEVSAAVLEAATPLLADEIAQKILEHAERQHPRDPDHVPTAWHRHFSVAARVAAGAFSTDEDMKRLAVEAIEREDWIRCDIPEVPGERT